MWIIYQGFGSTCGGDLFSYWLDSLCYGKMNSNLSKNRFADELPGACNLVGLLITSAHWNCAHMHKIQF